MGRIIAIAIPKGGVGKTTTALNLSIAFAKNGKRTLLIDVDPSGNCASSLGIERDDIKDDFFSVLNFSSSIEKAIRKTEIPNLDFMPIRHLNYLDELRLGRITTNVQLFRNILRPGAYSYDYIFIDCPPYLVGTTNSAIIAADSVLIPISPGQFALNAVNKILAYLGDIRKTYNPDVRVDGILLTIYEYNTKVSFATKKELFRKYPNLILNTTIPKNATVGEASVNKMPAIVYDPSAKASLAYFNLAMELTQRKDMFNLNSGF